MIQFDQAAATARRQQAETDLSAVVSTLSLGECNGNFEAMLLDAIALRGERVNDMRVGELMALVEEVTRHYQLQHHAWHSPVNAEVAHDALHH